MIPSGNVPNAMKIGQLSKSAFSLGCEAFIKLTNQTRNREENNSKLKSVHS